MYIQEKVTITVYRNSSSALPARQQWRWRMQSNNRVIIGASSEAFKRLSRCLENLHLVTGIVINSDGYSHFKDQARFLVEFNSFKSGNRIVKCQPVML